jgi:salicylate hydroxylase
MQGPARTVVVAGAGIGGLTAALALARQGFGVTLLEQAAQLEETGAGIQLSPNATRILLDLGLGERLRADAVAPDALRVRQARSGRTIATLPLGRFEQRFGAPYWMIHRADLQAALVAAARSCPDITLLLGIRADDFAVHARGVTVQGRRADGTAFDQRGAALVAADGLWSTLRARLGQAAPPLFRRRAAWRASVPADAVPPQFRGPAIDLWLGASGHLVHYPVKGGRLINIVAIVADGWDRPGWSEPAARADILERFPARAWATPARDLLAAPERWLKWALFDRPPATWWGEGPVTLLGDAAHPMLPFLAQGAGMAIEDAAVLAQCLGRSPDDPAGALRAYEAARRPRTARVQRAARRTGGLYQLQPPASLVRDLGMRALGGDRLLARYDWLYDWKIA